MQIQKNKANENFCRKEMLIYSNNINFGNIDLIINFLKLMIMAHLHESAKVFHFVLRIQIVPFSSKFNHNP